MGAFKEVSSFTLLLGVKINMDGIALVVNVGSIFDMKRMLVNITRMLLAVLLFRIETEER